MQDSRRELVLEDAVREVSFVAKELGLEVRFKTSIRSRCMSSMATIFLLTLERRSRADFLSPSWAIAITSFNAARVTEAKNAFVTLMEYSGAFTEYFEADRVLVTGSSMGK